MNQAPIPSADSLALPTEDSANDAQERAAASRERVTMTIASVVLYCILAWVAWPSLVFQHLGLGDDAWIDALRTLSLPRALLYVGDTWWRPGESAFFWFVARSGSLVPWRLGMLLLLLLTTAYVQLVYTRRSGSSVDGFGAALTFSVSPTTFSVVCWLSAANISLSAACILAYVGFARRALEDRGTPLRDVIAALFALALALSFYELAMFAPLVVVAFHLLFAPRSSRTLKRWLYGGSLACVALYLLAQAQLAEIPRFWQRAPVSALLTNSARHVSQNYFLWANPLRTFGVLIPDDVGDRSEQNLIGWALVFFGLGIAWYYRKRDPLISWSGWWFLIFLAPIGVILHVDAPLALHYLYIPMLGMALGTIRLLTRFVEWAVTSIRIQLLRVVFEGVVSLLLLWSLIPLVAECRRTVNHWGDSRELFLTSLQNYPTSQGSLAGLTQALSARAPQLTAAGDTPSPTWERYLDAFLLTPAPRAATQLLDEGREHLRSQRYGDASSALARALATSSTAQEQLDAGKNLVMALSHTALGDRTPALLERLRHDHPAHAEELVLPKLQATGSCAERRGSLSASGGGG